MTPEERRQFVRDHRTCVWGYGRQSGPPSMSVVYYVMDGDAILISTMQERGKAKALERNAEVSLCVLDEQWPLTYLVVYGRGEIIADHDRAAALMGRITELMSGQAPSEEDLAKIDAMCREEHRVVARITPVSTFETPPRHVYAETNLAEVRHGLGNTLAWDAWGRGGDGRGAC